MAASKRTTLRSRSGSKLYAKRNAQGEFTDVQTYKRAHGQDVKRVSKAETAARKSATKKAAKKKTALKKTAKKKATQKKTATSRKSASSGSARKKAAAKK